jgi:esterase
MPDLRVNGWRLSYEEHGSGQALCCVHGAGGSRRTWLSVVPRLAARGRLILYDRRGCGTSERPDPYPAVTMRDHAADLSALLRSLGAAPGVLIGRSYGGGVVVQLTLLDPAAVRAAVLLEPAITGLSAEYDAWETEFDAAVLAAAADGGAEAAVQVFLGRIFGNRYAEMLPAEILQTVSQNGPAIVAECRGPVVPVTAEELAGVTVPVLVVCANSSPQPLRDVAARAAEMLPAGQLARIEGTHLIDPAGPAVMTFLDNLDR